MSENFDGYKTCEDQLFARRAIHRIVSSDALVDFSWEWSIYELMVSTQASFKGISSYNKEKTATKGHVFKINISTALREVYRDSNYGRSVSDLRCVLKEISDTSQGGMRITRHFMLRDFLSALEVRTPIEEQ